MTEVDLYRGSRILQNKQDARWVNLAWFVLKRRLLVRDLTDQGVEVILQNLLACAAHRHGTPNSSSFICQRRRHACSISFVERLKFSNSPELEDAYQPIPYEFYELKNSFQGIADHAVDAARRLFVSGDVMSSSPQAVSFSAAFPPWSGCAQS